MCLLLSWFEVRQMSCLECPECPVSGDVLWPGGFRGGHENLSGLRLGVVKQGEECFFAMRVEFPHHIIDEQDGRIAKKTSKKLGLSHFEGNHQRPLLAFAGIAGSVAVLNFKENVVAMRANAG